MFSNTRGEWVNGELVFKDSSGNTRYTFKNDGTGLAQGGVAGSITFAPAAGTTNVCEVTITVKDGNGATLAGVHQFDLWLSDAASGAGHTAVTASGAVAVKTSSGLDVQTQVSKKALRVQTLATGIYILSITDSAKTAFYVAASYGGKTSVSAVLATANYG